MTEFKRQHYLNQLIKRKHNDMIKIITGLRRSGKSYLLNTLFTNHLLQEGVSQDCILQIDLEDIKNKSLREPVAMLQYIEEHLRPPLSLIEPVPVLRKPCQIEDPEVRASPARLGAGIGLAKIVEASPDELAVDLRIALLMLKLDIRRIIVRMRPPEIVAAHLGAANHLLAPFVAPPP